MLLGILILFICLFIALQSEKFQLYLTSKFTATIAESTGTQISTSKIKVSPFTGIALEDFIVYDPITKDTMVKAGALNVSLRKNLFILLNNKLDLSYIGLRDLNLQIITEQGQYKSNLDHFLINSGLKKDGDGKGSVMDLKLKEIELKNINVSINDKNKGTKIDLKTDLGLVEIDYMDLVCNELFIQKIILDRPIFKKTKYQDECKLEDELPLNKLKTKPSKQNNNPISIRLDQFFIRNGQFELENINLPKNVLNRTALDYNNFSFNEVNVIAEKIHLSEQGLELKLTECKAVDNTGFAVNKISMDKIFVGEESTNLNGMVLDFGQSYITDNINLTYFGFDAFSDFANQVFIDASLRDSKILIKDLTHFIGSLNNTPIFKKNINEVVYISGNYKGRINNLTGQDVDLKLGSKLSLSGFFSARDLLIPDRTLINIRLDRLKTSMNNLKSIIPGFKPPANFTKLGSIHFSGRYDGYYQDFVAFGNLKTDLGQATLDMKLDYSGGEENAKYSGNIALKYFNLGRWSDNPDLGLVSFSSRIFDGKGLTLNSAKAKLLATIQSIQFKKYDYKDISLNGLLDKNVFNGNLKIKDENIDIYFDGQAEYIDKVVFLNFTSSVSKLDLQAINLSEKPFSFEGDLQVDVSGSNINDFVGDIKVENLNIETQDTTYQMNKIYATSKNTITHTRELKIESDIGTFKLDGNYDIGNIVNSAKEIIQNNYPKFTENWPKPNQKGKITQKFDFNIQFSESKNFLGLLGIKNGHFTNLSLKGRMDTQKREFSIATEIPKFNIGEESFQNIKTYVTLDRKSGDIFVRIDSTFALGRSLNPIDVITSMKSDTLDFSISTENINKTLESIDIKGRLSPHQKGYNLTFLDYVLIFLNTKWSVNRENNLVVGKEYIDISNFYISDGNRKIQISDIDNRGINVDITDFDLDLLNPILKEKKMIFGGATNISLKIQDVFSKDPNINGQVQTPIFTINNDKFGAINIDIEKPTNLPLKANINIGDFLAVNGTYDLKEKTVDSKIKLRKAPLTILQYLLKDGIKDTKGYINSDITFGGPMSDLQILGEGTIHEGQTTVIITNSTYFFDKQKLKLTNTSIDLNGAQISDKNGNIGTIKGGLFHKLFKDFGADATISGNNVVGLNTSKEDNPDYYGYGVGQLKAEFKGLFSSLNMYITAISGPGTKLAIPVGNEQLDIKNDFIQFIKKDSVNNTLTQNVKLEGINIQMSLTLTPDAEVSIIFNESKGDIIKGTGRGNLKIDITREGDFDIFGDYQIEQGQYLFTIDFLPVAKPFVVERGGLVRWVGDPVNTLLDIKAKYRSRTSIYPFIQEYLNAASQIDINDARQLSEVDLKLNLGGTLFKPDISFDLEFPNLTGNIANYAQNKLRIIKSNQQEINAQALGLIVWKSFLPSNSVSDIFGANAFQTAGINTLSEFVASQFSVMMTNILNSFITQNGIISSLGFDVNVRNNNFGFTSTGLPDEIGVRQTLVFKDDRFSLDIGGNYVFQNQGLVVNQILPDFSFEMTLTEDRKLKIRVFGKSDFDPVQISSLRERYGLGIVYRSEFGKMVEFNLSPEELLAGKKKNFK